MTHIYYISNINGFGIENSEMSSKSSSGVNITIIPTNVSPSMFGVSRYKIIEEYLYKTNNFNVCEFEDSENSGPTFSVANTVGTIANDFSINVGQWEDVNFKDSIYMYDPLHPNDSDNDDTKHLIASINAEMSAFCKNLKYDNTQEDIYYAGSIDTRKQEAFGGNAGGRNAKFKAESYLDAKAYYKMMDGDYPRNDKGYVPIAYPVGRYSKDAVMVKHYG